MNQNKQANEISKTTRKLMFLLVLVSPLFVLQVANKELFLWLQIIFVFFIYFKYNKLNVITTPMILVIFFLPFITGIFAYFSSMTEPYKRTAINLAIMSIPLYFVLCCIKTLICRKSGVIEIIIKALKMVIIIELLWILIQLFFYRVLELDINKLIFVDLLHVVENASFIRSWVWYPSGLSWHSAVLAPLFTLGILLFDNPVIRLLILLESFLCGNNTTLIGVVLCIMLLFLFNLYAKRGKINQKKIKVLLVLVILFCIVAFTTNITSKLIQVVISLWNRLFSVEKDASTAAHIGYYSDYLTILKNSSFSQILFGYGTGCSGYTITTLYGRYADGGTWAIESDYINILVSRGIIGFINYYWLLFYIMIKGRRIDKRYTIFILTILIQGFGYNIQFDYLLLIEIVMYITIKEHINIFSIIDQLNKKHNWKRGRHAQNINYCCNVQ